MQYSLDFAPPAFIQTPILFFRSFRFRQKREIGFLHFQPVYRPLRVGAFCARRFPARLNRNAGAAPSARRCVRPAKKPNDFHMMQNRARVKSGKLWAEIGHICRG